MTYLPQWLEAGPDLFVAEDTWRLAYGLGMDPSLPERHQRALLTLLTEPCATRSTNDYCTQEADFLAVLWVLNYRGLTKTGRVSKGKTAEMWHSFRAQLVEWLDQDPGDPDRFDNPFSVKQWDRVLRGRWSGYYQRKEQARRVVLQLAVDLRHGGEAWPEQARDLIPEMEHGKVTYNKPRTECTKPTGATAAKKVLSYASRACDAIHGLQTALAVG